MSRNPQQLGFPRLKIRIEGEDGLVPEQRLELEQLQGEINRFYLGVRQQIDLTGQPGHKQFKALPGGGQLRYSLNEGQETLDVRLSPKKGAQEEEKKKPPKEPWDFLVIDLSNPVWSSGYPDSPTTRASRMTVGAKLVTPAPTTEVSARDNQSFNSATQQSSTTDPILMFAGAAAAHEIGSVDVVTPDTQVSSLLVDIRKFKGEPIIEIDLYGTLSPVSFSKGMVAIVTRYVTVEGGVHVPRTRMLYVGGAATRTYVTNNFPAIDAAVDYYDTTSPMNNLIPYPDTRGSVSEATLLDPTKFSPDSETWLHNNIDIPALWYETMTAGWTDVIAPYGPWASGYWSDEDYAAWQAMLDSLYNPPAGGDVFPNELSFLGNRSITVQGNPFWWEDGSGTGTPPSSTWYWGIGDVGTPPPNNYGYSSGSFFQPFRFAQARNTYIYAPSNGPTPSAANSTGALTASAFRGFSVGGLGSADFQWSRHKPSALKTIYDAIGSTVWAFGRWELTGSYPTRPTLGPLAASVPLSKTNVPANPGGGAYLGRITFTQDGGSFSFKPA